MGEIGGFLARQPVSALRENGQLGIGHELMSLFRPSDRDELVVGSVKDQGGQGDLGEPLHQAMSETRVVHFIGQVGSPGPTRSRNGDCPGDLMDQFIGDPLLIVEQELEAPLDGPRASGSRFSHRFLQTRNLASQSTQNLPSQPGAEPGTSDQNQAHDQAGELQGEIEGNLPTHREPPQREGSQLQFLSEAFQKVGIVLQCIGNPGFVTLSEAGQIGSDHPAGRGQLIHRRSPGEGGGVRSPSVDQNQGRGFSSPAQVMDLKATDLDPVILCQHESVK